MDPALLFLGAFFLLIFWKGKETAWRTEGSDLYTWMAIWIILLFVYGLGFIMPRVNPSFSFLVLMQVLLVTTAVVAKGPVKVISCAGSITFFVMVCIGPFASF